MGFFFRKSKSFGPVRLNLSKSGLDVSTGVKGARLSFDPRGTYVNLGRNGFYYRKKIGGSSTKKSSHNTQPVSHQNYNAYVQPNTVQTSAYDTDAIRVYDTNSVLGQEILKDVKKSKLILWAWIIASFFAIGFLQEWGLLICVVSGAFLWRFFTVRVVFDLEQNVDFEWQKLTEILYGLRISNRLWLIENEQYNSNRKVNAGAASSVVRGAASVSSLKPNRRTGFVIKTNVNSLLINSSKCKILFIPSGILVKKGAKTVEYSFDDINIVSTTVNFIESEAVARDAEVIRHTWQYVNRDGSPDRRFNNNRQIPVCRYGVISIRGNGIGIELQTSNKAVSSNVGNAYSHYKAYVANIGKAPENPRISSSGAVPTCTRTQARTDYSKHISREEWDLLEQMNDSVRKLGKNGYLGVLKEELVCEVSFIDGQIYQKHALFLYRASSDVSQHLSRVEYNINANSEYKTKLEAVSEREFLIHTYMDVYEGVKKELPLSDSLRDALSRAKVWKSMPQEKHEPTASYESEEFDYDDVLYSGASLFSGDIEDSTSSNDDPYEDLFSTSDKKKDGEPKQDNPVDDLLNFFDEE